MYNTHFNIVCDLGDGTMTTFSGTAVFDHQPSEDDIAQLPMVKGTVIRISFTFEKMEGDG